MLEAPMQIIHQILQRRIVFIAIIVMAIGCILVAWTLATMLSQPGERTPSAVVFADETNPEDVEPFEPEPGSTEPTIVVAYITGAITAPDVYQLPIGARVKDLVIAAGGFVPTADTQAINLAVQLTDAEHIHIPYQNQQLPEVAINATQAEPPPAAGVINLNTATAEQFDALPGIGPAIAERIIAYRQENGPFATIDDLANVKGVGTALIEKIRPLVLIE
jgi:competence protein ComEA